MKAWIGNDYVSIVDGKSVENFSICDDCQEAYLDPPYYVFEIEACKTTMPGSILVVQHENCTGNLCPDCAIDLMPDDEEDPRRER